MANIVVNDTNRPGSDDFLSKVKHAVGAFFSGGARHSRDLSELSDESLADIGLRRDQLMPRSDRRLSESGQRYYWI